MPWLNIWPQNLRYSSILEISISHWRNIHLLSLPNKKRKKKNSSIICILASVKLVLQQLSEWVRVAGWEPWAGPAVICGSYSPGFIEAALITTSFSLLHALITNEKENSFCELGQAWQHTPVMEEHRRRRQGAC